ncbi:response regulator [Derxia lacustris]|uniref:hypothetical protein n=1 Tax=Derxia lacustris TaxID=764842 RepID=UPI000A176513|nr:hypothetical protein [Derxia lacustris]
METGNNPTTAFVSQALRMLSASTVPSASLPGGERGRGISLGRVVEGGVPRTHCSIVADERFSAQAAELAARLAGELSLRTELHSGSFGSAPGQVVVLFVDADDIATLGALITGRRLASPNTSVLAVADGLTRAQVAELFSAGVGDFISARASAAEYVARIDIVTGRTERAMNGAAPSFASLFGNANGGEGRGESLRQIKTRIVSAFERGYIESLLLRCNGNISAAARIARKNRRAFFELMRKHQIKPDQFRAEDE